ncbi:uncharacterized protein LOC129889722 isoform X1 [Solanum dulcamara]|uniref:uncharacterized protein LOC129889722 isoform X1 n=1 Tax=Solanum dulcamara TaxID=45834 RepID=UPI002484FE9A|nr:uncharacterized protein LOC129889722 isoform X1 [Solanum dulcamara]
MCLEFKPNAKIMLILALVHHLLELELKMNRSLNQENQKRKRNIDLHVTEMTSLGDWICCLLRNSEWVLSSGNGSKNVLTELLLDGFQNLKDLCLDGCDPLTNLLKTTVRKK